MTTLEFALIFIGLIVAAILIMSLARFIENKITGWFNGKKNKKK